MATFENQERRMDGINACLREYGFESLDDLGKGLRSQVGTMFATKVKGPRYLEMAEGYVLKVALDDNNEICGYQFVHLGKMMEKIKKGVDAKEAYESSIGTYGRFEGAKAYIDPRED